MGATIRQQYKDPVDGNIKTRDMFIDTEVICPEDSIDGSSALFIKLEPTSITDPRNPQHNIKFKTISVPCPAELYCNLLDGKRNYNPPGCHRTILIEQQGEQNEILIVEDASVKSLNVNIGDPIVILSDIESSRPALKHYAIVKDVINNIITVNTTSSLPKFRSGAIVENLQDSWHRSNVIIGAKTQLKRPHSPVFKAFLLDDNTVEVIISMPTNLCSTQRYDIYIRDHKFEDICLHWKADLEDLSAMTDHVILNTYNGGPAAGGGIIQYGSKYYVTVIAKDGIGKFNVNESLCTIREV